MRKILSGAIVAVGLSGCAGATPMPDIEPMSADSGATASEGPVIPPPFPPPPLRSSFQKRLKFPKRAAASDPIVIDLDALPLAEPAPAAQGTSAFSLHRLDLTPRPCPPGNFANERITWSTDLGSLEQRVVRIGNITLPSPKLLDGLHYDYALEPLAEKAVLPTAWLTLSKGRSRDGADVTDSQGLFDTASGIGHARSIARAHATAIVDGVLYAFRRCTAHCEAPVGSRWRREELTLIGPPAVWTGSTAETNKQSLDRRTPFTRVTAPLEVGSSATLELVALDGDIDHFENALAPLDLSSAQKEKRWTHYALDVVWPAGSERPSLNLFVGHSEGDPMQIRPDMTTLFAEPEHSDPTYCRPEPPPRPMRELLPEPPIDR